MVPRIALVPALCALLATGSFAADKPTLGIGAENSSLIYAPGEPIAFTVTVDPPNASGYELASVVTDVSGKTVWTSRADLRTSSATVRVKVGRLGFYRLSVTLRGQGVALDEKSASFVVTPKFAGVSNDANPFGVNFHLTRIPSVDAERECRLARRIGIGWGRGMLPDWGDVARRPDGSYDWAPWDALSAVVRSSGISPVGGVYYMPKWASGAPPETTDYIVWSRVMPNDLSEFTAFCAEYASRYRDVVSHWEIGNEYDAEIFWRGSWKNYCAGDDEGIVRDYVRFLDAGRRGFLKGNPNAKILFCGSTGGMPKGATYQPFLEMAMSAGAGNVFDVMNTHYTADLPGIKDVLKRFGDGGKPVWITEIGGASAPGGRTLKAERGQIVSDIGSIVTQMANGAKRFLKYDFRDDGVDANDAESNFGLVYRDFSPKPSYAAYATLIRFLSQAAPKGELSVVNASDRGWLRGYAFTSRETRRDVNVLWLNDAPSAVVTLRSPEKSLTLVDIMGNRTSLKPVGGKVSVRADELPFIVLGRLIGTAGKPAYPAAKVVRTVEISLRNPGFEDVSAGEDLGPWGRSFDAADANIRAFVDPSVSHSGRQSLCLSIDKVQEGFPWVSQSVPFASLPTPGEGEYITVSIEGWVKSQAIEGRGFAVNCSYYDASGARISWMETSYKPGTRDWKLWSCEDGRIPAGTVDLRPQLTLGPGKGKAWFDDVRLVVKVWRSPKR